MQYGSESYGGRHPHLCVALGRHQETVGLDVGVAIGFSMVIPAAAIALIVLARHPEVAG